MNNFRKRFRSLPQQVVITCWMAQYLLLYSARRFRSLRSMVSNAKAVTVFSENQIPIITERLGVPAERCTVVDFGVDTDFFHPNGEAQGYVAVVGADYGRDWPTLLAAATRTPTVRYKILTWPNRLANLDVPANVEVANADHLGYRDLLQRA